MASSDFQDAIGHESAIMIHPGGPSNELVPWVPSETNWMKLVIFAQKFLGWIDDWLVVEPYPSEKNLSESQLGWWHAQSMESNKIHVGMGQNPGT